MKEAMFLSVTIFSLLSPGIARAENWAVHAGNSFPKPQTSSAVVEITNRENRAIECEMKLTAVVKGNNGQGPLTGVVWSQPNRKKLRPSRAAEYEFFFAPEVEKMRNAWRDPSSVLVAIDPTSFRVSCVESSGTTPTPQPQPGGLGEWTDDNRGRRQSRGFDPIDVKNIGMQMRDGAVIVSFSGFSVAPYARICDAAVLTKNAGTSYATGLLVDPAANFGFTGTFQGTSVERLRSERFVVQMSCLRWSGSGLPNPYQNPAHRPATLPYQICNPESDAQGCNNTCMAARENTTVCSGSTRWP